MKIRIKTLTPIHIGTGKELSAFEFFNNNYRINYDKLFSLLSEEKKDEFFTWIDQIQVKDFSVNEIIKRFNLNPSEITSKCSLYRFQQSLKEKVRETIKDSSNKMFIPGSSIKGIIRTALIYKILLSTTEQNDFLVNFIGNITEKAKKLGEKSGKIKNLLKSADDELEKEVFICGVEKQKNGEVKIYYDDQKYDLLKLIKVSDSNSLDTDTNGEISELQVYALKKTQPQRNFKIYTESIKKDAELEFEISVDIEFIRKAGDELKRKNSEFGKKFFIGIEQKFKNLFDLDITNDAEILEEKIVNSILNAFHKFGEAVSEMEKKWLKSISIQGNTNVKSLDELYKTKNKIKIGFGTGFSGMTILPLLLSNSELKHKAKNFYEAVGIGSHRSTKRPLIIDEFPFTRKYSNNQNIFSGFGWIQIVHNNFSASNQTSTQENKVQQRPPNTVLAEIIEDKSKPPKVKILEGEHIDKETILPGVRLEGLGLKNGSRIYIKLIMDKKNIQKSEFKGKAE